GKAVLCEKPLALTAAQVERMRHAALRAGRPLVEATWSRWHPRVRAAEALLRSGDLGVVRRVDAGFTGSGIPDDDYRWVPGRGGGALYDVGCDAVSGVLWAVGRGLPTSVTANAVLTPSGVDVSCDLELRWEADGDAPECVGRLYVGLNEPPRQWLRVEAARGWL
nr:Gfo/Idh/MocA family oxidoreductase [Micromonospora sp. DSM 115978]